MSESARRANARVHDFAGKEAHARELLAAEPLITTRELAAALGVTWPTAARYRRSVEAA
jgi:hypothetical protein